MSCRACGADLSPGARFCPSCGSPVARACAACAAELPEGARFCPSCGSPITGGGGADPAPANRDAPAEPARERKVATLLFADLVGFTSMGEAHDPELVGALVGDVFERVGTEVARYEGTIEKFAGDAMLAVFGVPSVHEDDAERAVRAALEMQSAMADLGAAFRARGRPEPQLRIGIETGEVLVDVARASAERDLFVTGDAVNTAARLQQTAAPGTVVVGPAAFAATRRLIEYEDLEAQALKGKAGFIAAWRAVAVKARRGGERAPLGLEAPIVGRDEEIVLLKETLRRTVADGRPHLMTIVGAAGVGKSRLTWELEKYLDGLPERYHWRKGRCLAYAQSSYSALADAIKADARIMDDDAPSTAVAKLDARMAEVHGADADAAIGEALRAVLALGSMAAVSREDLFDAWRRHLDGVAQIAPLVLVLEDIHWADEGLLDAIEFLARWGDGPVLIVCLARHELLERRPSWGGGMLNAAMIVLEPLDPDETSRLVDGLLGSTVPSSLRDRIVELADGNPLFSEELVRMFVDRGVLRYTDGQWELVADVDEIEVPGSVQAVLAARLDGLPTDEKRLAQNAAVVGRIFWDAAVAHLARQGARVTEDVIRRLRVKELVVPRQPSSLAGAAEYGFRHVLIRDVAYDSLPKRDRATLHLAVARWAEKALAERREEFVELLAAHYVAALRYEEEFTTSEEQLRSLRQRTYEHVLAAAHHAERLEQMDSATSWIRTAVELGRRLDLAPADFASLTSTFLEMTFGTESGAATAPIVLEALRRLDDPTAGPVDPEMRAHLQAEAGRTLYMAQRFDEARAVLENALAAGPPPAAKAHLLQSLGWVEWRLGRMAEAEPVLEEAIRLAADAGNDRLFRVATHDLGIAVTYQGGQRGMELVRQSFELAKAAGDVNLLGRCYINLPSLLVLDTEPASVIPLLDEGIDWSRRRADAMRVSWIAGNYAELLQHMGRLPESRALYLEGVDAAQRVGDAELAATKSVSLALVMVLMGDREEAQRLLTPEVRSLSATESQTHVFLLTVEAWLALPDLHEGIRRLSSILAESGVVPNAELPALALARIAFRAGRSDLVEAAAQRVRDAVAGYENGPRFRNLLAVADALADGSDAAWSRVEAAGDALAGIGYALDAAEAWSDAALLAARAGATSGAASLAARARDAFATASCVPPLGDPVDALDEVTAGRA